LRPNEGLGAALLAEAKASLEVLPVATLEFDLDHTPNGQHSRLRDFAGQSGELLVEKLALTTARRRIEHLLVAARSDSGEALDTASAERLLILPARRLDESEKPLDETELAQQLAQQENQKLDAALLLNERYFNEETEKLDGWAEDRRIGLDIRIKQLDQEIKEARKAARLLTSLQDKLNVKRAIKQLEQERDRVMLDYHEEKKRIDAEEDRLLNEIEAALEITPQRQRLFAIRWRLKAS
jgi:hypothetical protein